MGLVIDQGAAFEPLGVRSKDDARIKSNGVRRNFGRRIYEGAVEFTRKGSQNSHFGASAFRSKQPSETAIIVPRDMDRREIVQVMESRGDTRHLPSTGEAPGSSGSG
jgi:hypothetical protein